MCNYWTISFEVKFSYLKCVAFLSLVPILKPFWRRLVTFFETVTLHTPRIFSLGSLCSDKASNDYRLHKAEGIWKPTSFPGSSLYLEVERGPWERGCLKTQQWLVILCTTNARSGKTQDNGDAIRRFRKVRYSKCFPSSRRQKACTFSNSSGLKCLFENFVYLIDVLVWTVEIKLLLKIFVRSVDSATVSSKHGESN